MPARKSARPRLRCREEHRDEAGEERRDREEQAEEARERAQRGGPSSCEGGDPQPQQAHPRRLARAAPEEDEVDAGEEEPPGAEERTRDPTGTEAADERRHQCEDARQRHEEDDREARVRCEGERPGGDARVRAQARLAASRELLGAQVETHRRGADAAHHLLGEPSRLPRDRDPQLGARGDVTDRSLRLLAREDIVGQLERARAGERRRDESVQLAAGGELGHDPFEHAVADERPRHILRERAGQGAVDDPRHLRRREDVVGGILDPAAPGAGGRPGRKERSPSRRVGETWTGVIGVGHGRSIPRFGCGARLGLAVWR